MPAAATLPLLRRLLLPAVALAFSVWTAGCSQPELAPEALDADGLGAVSQQTNSPPVRLRYASYSYAGLDRERWNVVADVATLDSNDQEQVTLVYRDANGTWRELEGSLLYLQGDRQLWQVNGLSGFSWDGKPYELEFALRYRVGDRVYWDNNGGRNYRAATGMQSATQLDTTRFSAPMGPGTDLALTQAAVHVIEGSSPSLVLELDVLVRDLARHKDVVIDYSIDRWGTPSGWGRAKWSKGQDGGEHWHARLPLAAEAKEIYFTLSAYQGEHTARDDNFGKSFRCWREDSGRWTCFGDALVRDPGVSYATVSELSMQTQSSVTDVTGTDASRKPVRVRYEWHPDSTRRFSSTDFTYAPPVALTPLMKGELKELRSSVQRHLDALEAAAQGRPRRDENGNPLDDRELWTRYLERIDATLQEWGRP